MTQEEQATVLARWLSEPPGTLPPPELDPDVVESMYALRPELAPAPDVDLDEILASVSAGPLAKAGAVSTSAPEGGGEVVAFPTSGRAAPAPTATGGSWWRWATLAAGGTSSLGLLVAAAAVLLFVALPQLPRSNESAPAAAEAPSEPQAARSAPAPADAPPPPPPPPPPAASRSTADSDVTPMRGEPALRERSTIPELAEGLPERAAAPAGPVVVSADAPESTVGQAASAGLPPVDPAAEVVQDAVADLDDDHGVEGGFLEQAPSMGVAAAPPPAAAPAEAPRAVALARDKAARDERKLDAPATPRAEEELEDAPASDRASAVPRDLSANGWRRGVDKATQQVFDAALTEAEATARQGDARGAAERLAAAVGAPARAGQYVAGRAAASFLTAGDPAAAAAVARRGLALSSDNTPERSQLLLVLGDALQAAGDATGAEDAWRQAAAANASR